MEIFPALPDVLAGVYEHLGATFTPNIIKTPPKHDQTTIKTPPKHDQTTPNHPLNINTRYNPPAHALPMAGGSPAGNGALECLQSLPRGPGLGELPPDARGGHPATARRGTHSGPRVDPRDPRMGSLESKKSAGHSPGDLGTSAIFGGGGF